MAKFDDPTTTEAPRPHRRRLRPRDQWLIALAVALVAATAIVVQASSDEPVRVATATTGDNGTTSSTATTGTTVLPEETPSTSATPTSTTAPSTTTTAAHPTTTTTTTSPLGKPTVAMQPVDFNQEFGLSAPPGGILFPKQAGWSDWKATSNGITFHARIDPAVPTRGQVAHFHLDVSRPSGSCCVTIIDSTGGAADNSAIGTMDGHTCPTIAGNAFDVPVVYNQAGLVHFFLRSGDCAWNQTGWISGWIQVADGQSNAQGPAAAAVDVKTGAAGPDGRGLALHVTAHETDGWLNAFVVDWGDGTAPVTFPAQTQSCTAVPPSGWPGANYAFLPSRVPGVPPAEHRYAASGTYTVRITARSTACDGSHPQDTSTTITWSPSF